MKLLYDQNLSHRLMSMLADVLRSHAVDLIRFDQDRDAAFLVLS